MKFRYWLLFSFLFLATGVKAQQPWSGIVDPSRAINWSLAGVPGGIPNRTVQCGSTIAAGATAATINAAIAACPANEFVSLGSGTFNISALTFGTKSNVSLRGQGANETFLVFSSGSSCNGITSGVCMAGSNSAAGFEQNVCNWTAGYSTGTTVITLANCGSTTPAAGSLANLHVGSIIILDQVDETNDPGTIWNCLGSSCATTGNGGFARANGPCVAGTCSRSQEQGFVVTNISGSNITITPGLYMPNWRSGQAPQAWYATSDATLDGLENLSMDFTNAGQEGLTMMNCNECWESGVRSMVAGRSHVMLLGTVHSVIQNNYYYQSQSHATVSYGVEEDNAFDNLIQNNISQQITDSMPNNNGGAEGNVNAYNFAIDDVYVSSQGWMQPAFYQHASGDALNLWEGNISPGYTSDDIHGTHHFETLFRNYLIGNQAAGCGSAGLNTCTAQTTPVHLYAGSRYANVIGNVLGQSGYHNNYQCVGSSSNCGNSATSIYTVGTTGDNGSANSAVSGYCLQPACSSLGDYDPQVLTYVMRWGNYDTVNAAVRFVNSEVPSGIAQYSNPVPASQTLPASFYLTSKPAWFGNTPFPSIGPDVTGGTVSGVGGHVYENAAMSCYTNTMGGVAAGTGSVLTFSASSCYPQSTPVCTLPTTTLGWTWSCPQLSMSWPKINLLSKVDDTDVSSAGTNCPGPAGGTNCETQLYTKYGSNWSAWTVAKSTQMNSMGFTGAGYYSYRYQTNWASGDLPVEATLNTGQYAIQDAQGGAPAGPYHVKNAAWIQTTAGMKCGTNYYNGGVNPDPYDPEFPTAFHGLYAATITSPLTNAIFFQTDDGDNLFLMDQVSSLSNSHGDGGLIVASIDPVVTISSPAAGGAFSYSNKTYFAKLGLRDWLLNEYLCTGAGTPVSTCTGSGTGTGSADPSSGSYVGSTNASTALSAFNSAWHTSYTTWNTSDSGGLAGIASGSYASYGTGTGLLDENGNNLVSSGQSCGGLTGNGPQQNESWGKYPQIQTDVDHWLAYGFGGKWASQVWAAYSAACTTNCVPMSIPLYGGPVSPASSSVYAGMSAVLTGDSVLFWVAPDASTNTNLISFLQSIITTDGGFPIVVGNYFETQADSYIRASACPAGTIQCLEPQSNRGLNWVSTEQSARFLQNSAGKFPVVGFEHWSLYDSYSQTGGFGILTANDNAYDGSSASTATSSGSCATNHAYTTPSVCLDPHGNFESLTVTSCTSAASGTVWGSSYGDLTVDNNCRWFNDGSYSRIVETGTFGNVLYPVVNFNLSNLADSVPAPPTNISIVVQ